LFVGGFGLSARRWSCELELVLLAVEIDNQAQVMRLLAGELQLFGHDLAAPNRSGCDRQVMKNGGFQIGNLFLDLGSSLAAFPATMRVWLTSMPFILSLPPVYPLTSGRPYES
jgi:hypothetical protein